MYRVRNIVFFVFLTGLMAASCRNEPEKDLSLSVEEYKKLGMPDPDKIWNNDDYINANITLGTIKTNYPLSLPRKESKKSGTLFGRLVNEENLSFIYDTLFPLRIRAYLIQPFTGFQSEMQQFYMVEVKGKKPYPTELTDINIFGLTVHEKMLELAWMIMNSDDESDKSIRDGMAAVKHNYLRLISRLLEEQMKIKEYDKDDLERLSIRLSGSIEKNQSWFPPDDRKSLISDIEEVVKNLPEDKIRSSYVGTLKYLNDTNN